MSEIKRYILIFSQDHDRDIKEFFSDDDLLAFIQPRLEQNKIDGQERFSENFKIYYGVPVELEPVEVVTKLRVKDF